MEAPENIQQLKTELLNRLNRQLAVRRYLLDERVGSISPRELRKEISQLEKIREHLLTLGDENAEDSDFDVDGGDADRM
jgi:hypothetical protein